MNFKDLANKTLTLFTGVSEQTERRITQREDETVVEMINLDFVQQQCENHMVQGLGQVLLEQVEGQISYLLGSGSEKR